MKFDKVDRLKIKLDGDETKNFKSVIKKCCNEDSKTGFGRKVFTEDERSLLDELKKKCEG